MGANCCVAMKGKTLPDMARFDASLYMNTRHSPSWSFRRDNRTHIEDNMDNAFTQFHHHHSVSAVSEIRSGAATDTEDCLHDGSPSSQVEKLSSSLNKTGYSEKSEVCSEDQFVGRHLRLEGKNTAKPPCFACASEIKSLTLVPSSPVEFKGNPSSSRSHSEASEHASSQVACHFPEHQLSRQILQSEITSSKALNKNSSPGRGQSIELSTGSSDLPRGSHGGLPDGWSLRTFTELVASCQKDRLSCESENLSSKSSKVSGANTVEPIPVTPGHQTCRLCSKLLKDKSVADAVLACGHVYHADCLENITPVTYIFDPPCPICIHGEKSAAKLFGKVESKGKNKIFRIEGNAGEDAFWPVRARRGPRLAASSSMKSSYRGPTMRRHFSLGMRSRSASASETSSKRGFWGRY